MGREMLARINDGESGARKKLKFDYETVHGNVSANPELPKSRRAARAKQSATSKKTRRKERRPGFCGRSAPFARRAAPTTRRHLIDALRKHEGQRPSTQTCQQKRLELLGYTFKSGTKPLTMLEWFNERMAALRAAGRAARRAARSAAGCMHAACVWRRRCGGCVLRAARSAACGPLRRGGVARAPRAAGGAAATCMHACHGRRFDMQRDAAPVQCSAPNQSAPSPSPGRQGTPWQAPPASSSPPPRRRRLSSSVFARAVPGAPIP